MIRRRHLATSAEAFFDRSLWANREELQVALSPFLAEVCHAIGNWDLTSLLRKNIFRRKSLCIKIIRLLCMLTEVASYALIRSSSWVGLTTWHIRATRFAGFGRSDRGGWVLPIGKALTSVAGAVIFGKSATTGVAGGMRKAPKRGR